MIYTGSDIHVHTTPIRGLLVIDIPVPHDNRGWFKENWQREKMAAAGLPDFRPVQQNISFNTSVGTTRGLHAEPWDKLVSAVNGRWFGAWVDLREGDTFGVTFTCEIDASQAVFVPEGVANGYQTLEPNTTYSYLVNDHWSPDAQYSQLNVGDEALAIQWPIPLGNAVLSDKDRLLPRLGNVTPIRPKKTLVTGCNGQLGQALRAILGSAERYEYVDVEDLDLTDWDIRDKRHWHDYDTIINAAAYTGVDDAETPELRRLAWAVNAAGPANLARIATEYGITLVHISSDYVFNGEGAQPSTETSPMAPLGVYGQTKAAADLAVHTVPHHYIVRTSWVVGDGKNFVRTMLSLAEHGAKPEVVDDQTGRLTFTQDLARGIVHLLRTTAPFGTYNLTNEGPEQSWAEIAQHVFALSGHDARDVTPVSTARYEANRGEVSAPRPRRSTLDLTKIEATGFRPRMVDEALADYVAQELH